MDNLTDLVFMMLMGFYVAVKGGASDEEIERLCGVAVAVVESWRVDVDRSEGAGVHKKAV